MRKRFPNTDLAFHLHAGLGSPEVIVPDNAEVRTMHASAVKIKSNWHTIGSEQLTFYFTRNLKVVAGYTAAEAKSKLHMHLPN
jgi:hypothetical protein